jgi:two-component system, OmpR family, sensor histidine kinase ChvG
MSARWWHFTPGIRTKVLLASSTLLLIPWIGYAFVAEMDRLLNEGQSRMLADSARAVAAVVQERASALEEAARRPREAVPALRSPIAVESSIDDWQAQAAEVHRFGGEHLAELRAPWTAESLSFRHAVGRRDAFIYAIFDVNDDRVVYCVEPGAADCDHLRITIDRDGRISHHHIGALEPGPLVGWEAGYGGETAEWPEIEGLWREREGGYVVGLRLPAEGITRLAFAVADVDDPDEGVAAVMAAVAPRPELRPRLRIGADVESVLDGMARANLRIWLIDRERLVLLRAGQLETGAPPEEPVNGWWRAIEPLRAAFLPAATSIVDAYAEVSRLDGPEVEAALSGAAALRAPARGTAAAYVNAAAHPIALGGETLGAVVVEQSTASISRIRRLAFERLLVATLAAFVCGSLLLVYYVSRVSSRLRRLRDEAERAIDNPGHVRGLVAGSRAGDEIGDLSRSYSAMLERLAQYTDYLENLARRLNHELRTPIAVVRSSLDNLRSELTPGSVYLDRAEAGLNRLSAILSRMSEATRLEEMMRRSEREAFDLDEVVAGCAEGYRLAYAPAEIRYHGLGRPVRLSGVPDLIAQMLDKLVENAVEFAAPGTPVVLSLNDDGVEIVLAVRNEGPPLPAAMEGHLFESMVSVQGGRASATPHLGLGLYIVKLIAAFHHATAAAVNRSDRPGVEVSVRFARYVSDPA